MKNKLKTNIINKQKVAINYTKCYQLRFKTKIIMSEIKNVLIGDLIAGDFQESTLTFEIDAFFKVKAGQYALIELDDYQTLKRALTSCKMSLQAHPDNQENSEFEGFVSLADEILIKVNS